MKKIYTFFALLLLCAVTATAQTAVTVISSSSDATTYGSLSSGVFTTNDASGLAGVTVTGPTGTTATSFAYGACLAFVNVSSGTITLAAPDGYVITGYTMTVRDNTYAVPYRFTPAEGGDAVTASTSATAVTATGLSTQTTTIAYASTTGGTNSFYIPSLVINVLDASTPTVNVTYELYDASAPTTLVNSTTVVQETNSAISIPFTIASYYTVATSGTIGTEDCTIIVTRTLNEGVVLSASDFSNDKVYTISTYDRGSWYVPADGTQVTSTTKAGVSVDATSTAQQFAFISYNSNLYLYSVSEKKFISKSGTYTTLTDYPGDNVTLLSSTGDVEHPVVVALQDGAYHAGISNGYDPAIITHYNSLNDGGNRAFIVAVADFDPTEALERFADRTPYFEALNAMISAAQALPFGTTIHTYAKGSDYDTALSTAQATYANADATIDELTAATNALTTAIANCTLNLPTDGFYRIKGKTSGKYLAGTLTAEGTKFAMSDATDATTIFYYSGTKLISYSTGMENGMTGNVWAWNYDGEGATVVFQDGLTNGGYAIQSGGNGNFYDAGTTADRGRDVTINASTNARYTSWYLEPVTELPITLRSTDNTNYFATFSAPVPVEINGATLNNVTPKANSISYKAVDTNLLPANTGVLLTGTSASATATIITETVETVDYGLTGYSAAFAVAEADQTSKLFLGRGSQSGKAGFYALGSASTNGFKAYFANSSGEAKEGFDLVNGNEVTGVDSLTPNPSPEGKGSMYNLQGQRVNKAQKGVFIQNGKKVVVK